MKDNLADNPAYLPDVGSSPANEEAVVLWLAVDLQGVVVEGLFVHQLLEQRLGPVYVIVGTVEPHLQEGGWGGASQSWFQY